MKLWDDVTLIRCGGHFSGGSVLNWAGGADGRGVVCWGDILNVTTDRKGVTFMRNYPNFIPSSPPTGRWCWRIRSPATWRRWAVGVDIDDHPLLPAKAGTQDTNFIASRL